MSQTHETDEKAGRVDEIPVKDGQEGTATDVNASEENENHPVLIVDGDLIDYNAELSQSGDEADVQSNDESRSEKVQHSTEVQKTDDGDRDTSKVLKGEVRESVKKSLSDDEDCVHSNFGDLVIDEGGEKVLHETSTDDSLNEECGKVDAGVNEKMVSVDIRDDSKKQALPHVSQKKASVNGVSSQSSKSKIKDKKMKAKEKITVNEKIKTQDKITALVTSYRCRFDNIPAGTGALEFQKFILNKIECDSCKLIRSNCDKPEEGDYYGIVSFPTENNARVAFNAFNGTVF